MKLWVVLILIMVAVIATGCTSSVRPDVVPNIDSTQVPTAENPQIVYVTVTLNPEPTYPTYTVVPTVAPTPKPRPAVFNDSEGKNLFDIFSGDLEGNIPLDIAAERFGANPYWKHGSGPIFAEQVRSYIRDNNRRAVLVEGSFKEFMYSDKGMIHYASNVSIVGGLEKMPAAKDIVMCVSFPTDDNNAGTVKTKVAYFYKNNLVVAVGWGQISVRYVGGSSSGDSASGSSESSVSGSSNSGGGGGSEDSGGPSNEAIQ